MSEYLVVLSILEGKKFPKQESLQIVIEALFDGEVVQTDPTEHNFNPEFNTELTWLLDKKSLHMHRLQRSPLKVQCYALGNGDTRVLLGYIIIDIRLALEDPLPPKWYPLLNSKYRKQKPEILIGLSLERHDSSHFMKKITEESKIIPQSRDVEGIHLNEKDCLYEIGEQKGASVFNISVTIACVKNLDSILSKSYSGNELFFYYSLFGNDVTTDTFENSSDPEFLAERASLKIKSTSDNLRSFLSRSCNIEVYLCDGDITLGKANIPLLPITEDDQAKWGSDPKVTEGLFEIQPFGDQDNPNVSEVKTVVGISVEVKKENKDVERTPSSQNETPPCKKSPLGKTEPGQPIEISRNNSSEVDAVIHQSEQRSVINFDDFSDNELHQFCFTLDLKKVTLNYSSAMTCSLRYVYPFFGTYKPIMTKTVDLRQNTATTVPQGYCLFKFAASRRLLYDTLNNIPIIVELFNHQANNKTELCGIANVLLRHVLDAQVTEIPGEDERPGKRQLHTSSIPIQSTKHSTKMGDVFVVMALDDYGIITKDQIEKLRSTNLSVTSSDVSTVNEDVKPKLGVDDDGGKNLSRDAAIQAAVELQAWKEQQQIVFQEQLKEKEKKHLAALSTEWINRDKEREQILKHKLKDHETIENKLREALNDVENRQKKLVTYEQEVSVLKSELKQQKNHLSRTHSDSIQRIREESKLGTTLEKAKNEDLSKRLQVMTEERDKLMLKMKSRDKDFENYKSNLKFKPEIQLQNQFDIMVLEKAELERRLETSLKSKIHYKQQWGRALRELSRIKNVKHEETQRQVWRQEKELEVLRTQRLMDDRPTSLETERKIIQELQSELNKLVSVDTSTRKGANEAKKSDYVKRLENERNMLLETGVYTMHDKIIIDMNKNIQEAMMS